jgi:hypothetical protein
MLQNQLPSGNFGVQFASNNNSSHEKFEAVGALFQRHSEILFRPTPVSSESEQDRLKCVQNPTLPCQTGTPRTNETVSNHRCKALMVLLVKCSNVFSNVGIRH